MQCKTRKQTNKKRSKTKETNCDTEGKKEEGKESSVRTQREKWSRPRAFVCVCVLLTARVG